MRAYHLERFRRVEGIVLRSHEEPEPGSSDIVIRVRAASINRRDIMILDQAYPMRPATDVVPLSDGAGEVVAVGDDVLRFRVGDRVTGSYWPRWRDGRLGPDLTDQLGCTVDGMATEYAVLNEQWAVRLPDHLSWEEGACLSCAGVTAWCSVVGTGAVGPGSTVLTLGTGDVSLFALQFAKLLGCQVITTTSRREKADRLRELGADHVINYLETPAWGDTARDLTGGRGVDLVVETTGPETIKQSIIASALYGDIVILIWQTAAQPNLVLPGDAYGPKLGSIRKLFVGSRTDLEAMLRAMATHQIRPVVDRVFAFDDLHAAYHYFLGRTGVGKVVVRVS
jgi:NADPH:quinone reductase-like Zn-dependent oxidoreductase